MNSPTLGTYHIWGAGKRYLVVMCSWRWVRWINAGFGDYPFLREKRLIIHWWIRLDLGARRLNHWTSHPFWWRQQEMIFWKTGLRIMQSGSNNGERRSNTLNSKVSSTDSSPFVRPPRLQIGWCPSLSCSSFIILINVQVLPPYYRRDHACLCTQSESPSFDLDNIICTHAYSQPMSPPRKETNE